LEKKRLGGRERERERERWREKIGFPIAKEVHLKNILENPARRCRASASIG